LKQTQLWGAAFAGLWTRDRKKTIKKTKELVSSMGYKAKENKKEAGGGNSLQRF